MALVLLKAVSAGRPRQVRLLLDSGISTEVSDDCGQTPLIRTVFIDHARSREKITRILLNHGAQVSKADIVGRTALSWACLYGRDKEVAAMLDGADVDLDLNQADMQGQTALFHAATSGSAAAVKLVVDGLNKYDLKVEVPNNAGLTPLMQALKLGNDVCASILIQYGNAKPQFDPEAIKDLRQQEKWATQSTRFDKAARMRKTKHSKFPPILPTSIVQKIQYRENKAKQMTILMTPQNSDDDSMYSSEYSHVSDDTLASLCRDVSPGLTCRNRRVTPPSVRTVSKTSSTEAHADSDSDDGVDCFSTPVQESKSFRPTKDLHRLYRIFEEQHCPAHRPGAAKPKPLGGSTDHDSSVESGIGGSPREHCGTTDRDAKTQVEDMPSGRKKKAWRRGSKTLQVPCAQTLGSNSCKFPPPPPPGFDTSSSSESDFSDKIFTPRKTLLPRILGLGSKTVSLVQAPRNDAQTDTG